MIKDYTKSKGVYLLLGMGGPQTQFEELIRSDRGLTWGSTLMFDSLQKAYDGIFVDFYFNSDDLCDNTIKQDSCLCQAKEGNSCEKYCGVCTNVRKCQENNEDTWMTFMEQVLTTASGIISSDDMIGYR